MRRALAVVALAGCATPAPDVDHDAAQRLVAAAHEQPDRRPRAHGRRRHRRRGPAPHHPVGPWDFAVRWSRVAVSRWSARGAVVIADAVRVRSAP